MINLRYHIVSIAAVFLALAIGLALGSTFVDSVLVSNLESRVDQLQADTESAVEQQKEAQAALDTAESARDAALAEVGTVRSEVQDLVRPYLPQGRLSGKTTLIVATESTDRNAVAAIRSRLDATDARQGGVLWLSDDLRLDDPGARRQIASVFSLAGDSRNAVRRALFFLVPQALFRPAEAGPSRTDNNSVSNASNASNVESLTGDAIGDSDSFEGFSRGFSSASPTRTALTLLRDLGLVTYDGTDAVALHLLGGESLRLVVVTDAGATERNEGFVFDLMAAIDDAGHSGTGVIVEVPAADAVQAGYGAVTARVRSDPVLAESFSSVDEVDTFSGDLALLSALEQLPEVHHFSGADTNHGLGSS